MGKNKPAPVTYDECRETSEVVIVLASREDGDGVEVVIQLRAMSQVIEVTRGGQFVKQFYYLDMAVKFANELLGVS